MTGSQFMAARQLIALVALVAAFWAVAQPGLAQGADDAAPRSEAAAGDTPPVKLYLFYSETCPHCAAARPFVEELVRANPWLSLEARSVAEPENQRLFFLLSRQHGREPEGVPAFFLCGRMVVGFDSAEGVGAELRSIAEDCRQRLAASIPKRETAGPRATDGSAAPRPIDIPLIGAIDPRTLSLPVLTLLLAGLDAFNPCAFFVLLFLLSLMVHARNRPRMALVGGTFVAISGLMYFLFMAAWLNLFLVLENVGWVTRAAGLVALAVGLLGIKDFFSPGEKPTLSVSETHKETLYARTRGLISAENMAALLVGTVALAIAANMYELICTSGFPLVYTRVLTLNALPPSANYAYLALYNVIYVLPLLAIVALFVWTLGSRKLGESEGRALKLLSGLVMLSMGVTLIVAPQMFDNPLAPAALLVAAAGVTGLVVVFRRHRVTGSP